MSAGDRANQDQFRQHIETLKTQLGVEYNQRGVTLPSGKVIPAMGHSMTTSHDSPGQTTQSVVPDERGNLHDLFVTTSRSDPSAGDRDQGYPTMEFWPSPHTAPTAEAASGITYVPSEHLERHTELYGDHPNLTTDPDDFHQRIAGVMSGAEAPDESLTKYNQEMLRMNMQQPRGSIRVTSMGDEHSGHARYLGDPSNGRVLGNR